MQFQDLDRYASAWSTPADDVLLHIERATHLYTIAPQMLSGPVQGALLTLLARGQQATHILEVGTFTAYSAICLARGLADGPESRVVTLESNPEFAYLIERHIAMSGLGDRIEALNGDAMKLIPTLPHVWDLVFLDANKLEYAAYFDLVIDRVRPGGLIVADNVLWGGKVLSPDQDADAAALHEFNQKLHADPRVDVMILTVRDGLSIARKR